MKRLNLMCPLTSSVYIQLLNSICFVASGCGPFSNLAEFKAAVEDMAGCSDVGCKVDVVEQETSDCTTCTIANTRKIRRRVQSSTELAGFTSKIKFEITATSASLDLTLVNQRLQTNLAASNDKLADANKLFRLTTVTITPQALSPSSTTSSVSHLNEFYSPTALTTDELVSISPQTSATTVAATTSSAGQNTSAVRCCHCLMHYTVLHLKIHDIFTPPIPSLRFSVYNHSRSSHNHNYD